MHNALKDLPVFDPEDFKAKTADWKKIVASSPPGGKRIVIEWSVGRGPNCFVYPAGARGAGINLTASAHAPGSDERWADFLEFEFVPQVVRALTDDGFTPQVICADLRPIQVMRQRRRAIESIAREKTGAGAH